MKKSLFLFILPIVAIAFSGCGDDDSENMVWKVVSNSNPEWIRIVNETTNRFDKPSNIWVQAAYKPGDVVLKCTNHPIAFSLIGPNDSYTNPEMGFTLSKVDANTLKIHFDEKASGEPDASDQITITNSDQKPVVCNTFLWISRTFGEVRPAE